MRLYDTVPNEDLAAAIKEIYDRPSCLGNGVFAVKGGADPNTKTTVVLPFQINHKIYEYPITADMDLSATTAGVAATAGGTGIQAATTYCCYLLTVDAALALDAFKGTDCATAALAYNALPEPPAAHCPIGYILVYSGTVPYIFGTTNYNAGSGLTMTAVGIQDIPSGYGEGAVYLDEVDE